ncbi:Probable inorganic phosphate transporter 1-7 [Linum perenne]
MLGALSAVMTYYSRSKMPETARYTALVAKDASRAAKDMSKVLQRDIEAKEDEVSTSVQGYGLLSKEFAHRHGKHLIGTTTTLFLLDIAFYSQNLFQMDIFSAVGWIPPAQTMNVIEEVFWCEMSFNFIFIIG